MTVLKKGMNMFFIMAPTCLVPHMPLHAWFPKESIILLDCGPTGCYVHLRVPASHIDDC